MKPTPDRSSTVALREITRENLQDILRLRVASEQEQFVASNAVSIAQAHFYPESAWYRAIYADETAVGFVLLEMNREKSEYFLWRFMIDHRFQRQGFGARAIELVLDHVRTQPGATSLSLSYVPADGNPRPFYEKMGFAPTGEMSEGEMIMRRAL
jgi:diamine N-acetyltransferase